MRDSKPKVNCHLWNNKKLTKEELYDALEIIDEYEDDSHLTRSLKCCRECGQLYFYEFNEIVDWKNGNDAQYRTWIPVKDSVEGEKLANMDSMSLLLYPSIRIDYPSSAIKPSEPYYSDI